eukprot:CAMPEP_0176382026 /NCGR_PEP_ID=MMETSP0126-20121128/32342_1 /TAXON_ID=141414 ORGANISM="Strombidinopsis acuminatum, Strain SPMC142" /NCGR_SAMPLE_ID=MMETSP0126 /ASSEMBLY_ACC=CAM_ASM_000229 /LENGTH=34 /DNA_ID= /DNA_START= /DNA_END= /DNA_ORIENTATION=
MEQTTETENSNADSMIKTKPRALSLNSTGDDEFD